MVLTPGTLVLLLIAIKVIVNKVAAQAPLAISDLIVVDAGDSIVIRLRGYDSKVKNLKYSIVTAPQSGSLYQLSQVFSTYGYEPKQGTLITLEKTAVTGSNNRIVYKRPAYDIATNNQWGTISFTVNNGLAESLTGTVTVVPPSGSLVGEDFLLNNGDWKITGNKKPSPAIFESFSRGLLLNHYIYGTDNEIDIDQSTGHDKSLWYFQAPQRFLGNQGIAYKGSLKFSLGSFSGNFSESNGKDIPAVELICLQCTGPLTQGLRLVFPASALSGGSFTGTPTRYSVLLTEHSGWKKDPQNILLPYTTPTQCDMIQVLSRLSSIRILGDWTTWYESVALDDVQFVNTKGQLPLCSMSEPDGSVCTCN